ncbi:hypothetical protein WJX84_001914 [Apatococcus fuscideae]|uniref:Uncharacterized protein n=1 Tax=Apatococcus fuscideae TaxID=2026836 RepID=A0AAW1SUY0_9CHLO
MLAMMGRPSRLDRQGLLSVSGGAPSMMQMPEGLSRQQPKQTSGTRDHILQEAILYHQHFTELVMLTPDHHRGM